MTYAELRAEAMRRLKVDHGVAEPECGSTTAASHWLTVNKWDDHASYDVRYRMSLEGRPFVSWSSPVGRDNSVFDVVWHFDEIGQPDLSFKGINKFKGRWEGETA